jgi:hypothetical protein
MGGSEKFKATSVFLIQNDLKEGHALLTLPFNFAFRNVPFSRFRKVNGIELNGTQVVVVVYA